MLSFSRRAHRVSRQEILRPEDLDLETSAVDAGNNDPRTMLDHRKAPGTEFRGPGFQLDTSRLRKRKKWADTGARAAITRP
jgi:hypothetical protein